MKLLTRVLIGTLALLMAAYFIPGIEVANFYIALIAAIILGLLNAVVRPVLIILTLPITILTLGLFTFVINALLFWFVASFIDGFDVSGFWIALLGSVFVTIVTSVGNKFVA